MESGERELRAEEVVSGAESGAEVERGGAARRSSRERCE